MTPTNPMTNTKTAESNAISHRINESYSKQFPRNCPVLEYTANGAPVGTCTFYLPDGATCPRHGKVKEKAL